MEKQEIFEKIKAALAEDFDIEEENRLIAYCLRLALDFFAKSRPLGAVFCV